MLSIHAGLAAAPGKSCNVQCGPSWGCPACRFSGPCLTACLPRQPPRDGATVDTCLVLVASPPAALTWLPTLLQHPWELSGFPPRSRTFPVPTLHPGGHLAVPWVPEQHPQILRPKAGWHGEKAPSLGAGVMLPAEGHAGGWGTPGHHCGGRGYPRAGLCDQDPNTGSEHPFHPHAAGFKHCREAGQPPASPGSLAAGRGPRDRGSPPWGTSGWPVTAVVRPGGLSKGWADEQCPTKQNTGAYLLNTRFLVASILGSTQAPRTCRGKKPPQMVTTLRKAWSFPKPHREH